ncbi:CxxxxCH/CxxCH domain-containing protein [Pectobacterium sp. CFBP8739]
MRRRCSATYCHSPRRG